MILREQILHMQEMLMISFDHDTIIPNQKIYTKMTLEMIVESNTDLEEQAPLMFPIDQTLKLERMPADVVESDTWEIIIFNGDPALCSGKNIYGDTILCIEWLYGVSDDGVDWRWLYLLITGQELQEFMGGKRSFRELIISAKSLYVKDEPRDFSVEDATWYHIQSTDIPPKYWPPEDSFLHEENGLKTLIKFQYLG